MNDYYRNNSYEQNYQSTNLMNNNINFHYKENLLRANIGKKVSIYASFPDSIEYRDKVFSGTIENVGNDHILIKTENKNPLLLQSMYINFIIFEE